MEKISRFFAGNGTTSWLCSVLTDTVEQTQWCIDQFKAHKAGEQPMEAIAAGAEACTHTFNAMGLFHQHRPAIMAAGLPDGKYHPGVNEVVAEDGDAKLADTGGPGRGVPPPRTRPCAT